MPLLAELEIRRLILIDRRDTPADPSHDGNCHRVADRLVARPVGTLLSGLALPGDERMLIWETLQAFALERSEPTDKHRIYPRGLVSDFRECHRLPAEWLPGESRRLDAGKDAYIAKAQGVLLTANLQRFPVSGTLRDPTESCRSGNSAARWLFTNLFQIVVFVLWGFATAALYAYRATGLQRYTATRIGKQRGARNGTPWHSRSLVLFSPEDSLTLFLLFLFIQISARPPLATI